MRLYFDTETTGIYQSKLPATHPSQPHLVQLAAILVDRDNRERASVNLIVKPDGYTIPKEASNVHGITTELALKYGVPLMVAVAAFTNLRALAEMLVAHNIQFDLGIMATAIHRTGRQPAHPGPTTHVCTMELSTPILKLPPTSRMIAAGFNKFKNPNLAECYRHFFDEELEGAHDAMVDVRGCMRVHNELMAPPT